MEKKLSNNSKLSEKAELIYKFDNSTPLFAVVAEKHIAENNLNLAEEILRKGLTKYPDYASAHFVLARVLFSLEKPEEAKEAYEKGYSLFENEQTKDYFEDLFSGNEQTKEEDNPILKELNEEILPEKETAEPEEEIISDTLAAVYFAQGAYQEALEMYEKLLTKHPDNQDFYSEKIEEIKKKLNPDS